MAFYVPGNPDDEYRVEELCSEDGSPPTYAILRLRHSLMDADIQSNGLDAREDQASEPQLCEATGDHRLRVKEPTVCWTVPHAPVEDWDLDGAAGVAMDKIEPSVRTKEGKMKRPFARHRVWDETATLVPFACSQAATRPTNQLTVTD